MTDKHFKFDGISIKGGVIGSFSNPMFINVQGEKPMRRSGSRFMKRSMERLRKQSSTPSTINTQKIFGEAIK